MANRKFTVCLIAVMVMGLAVSAQAGSKYVFGDVFTAVGNGTVQEWTPAGVLVQTLNTGQGGFTTGMAFDSSSNLYVTNFSNGTITQFDNSGNVLNGTWATGMSNPESISPSPNGAFPFLVGDAGSNQIRQFNSTGTLVNSFTALTQNRGTDWVDLQPDQKTVLYTSEGSSILSFNISTNTQNANFLDGLPGANAYALRTVLTGAFAGDVLVADSSNALLVNSGGIVMTYTLPGNGGGDFSLNLDPTGTHFWTGDFATGEVWEVDIATGTILEQWNSGSASLFGITVFGEQGLNPTPEPGTLVMFGSGVLGLAGLLRRKFNV
jgi:PEP-CTERM motif